jgi:hypothetical protein
MSTPYLQASALLSVCARYRYRLDRMWSAEGPRVLFVMLNPSTANSLQDDPTLRRCVAFARAWGCGALTVVNVYAWRATNPRDIPREPMMARGPENERHLREAAQGVWAVVCAWGRSAHHADAARTLNLLKNATTAPVLCLGTTADGAPRHPLYLPNNTPVTSYEGAQHGND